MRVSLLLDSISPAGKRITTYQLEYPRFIHAELMTHREFSRNASSSRAISTERLLAKADADLVTPIKFGKEEPGMQATNALVEEIAQKAAGMWKRAYKSAKEYAEGLRRLGVHKQHTNRLLEPFTNITVLVTSTEWSNFFALRCDAAAQPEIRRLAHLMLYQYYTSLPTPLEIGEWHIPFIQENDGLLDLDTRIKVSVARCARVSYLNHDGVREIPKDVALHDRLLAAGHMSAFEHIAQCVEDPTLHSGNFIGWLQYRKTIPTEYRAEFPTREENLAYLKEN